MLLRVFVVALGLTYLCDDPRPEEWEDVAAITTADREGFERNGDGPQPSNKMAPAIQEVARRGTDDSGAFKEEGGDVLEGEGRAATTSHLVQGAQVDVSLSPNQSGNAAGSRRPKNGTFVSKEQLSQLRAGTSEKGPPAERDYLRCVWNAFSIFSVIHFIRKHLGKALQQRGRAQPVPAALPDSSTLERFHSTCVGVSSEKRRWEAAFLEGLASDLLVAMRAVCDESMAIEDVRVADPRHVVVPIAPPEPYGFRCSLLEDPAGVHACGQIKLVETGSPSCHHCQLSDADDVVCLLHFDAEPRTRPDVLGRFCLEGSLLSKSQVTKWFRSAVKRAWGVVSHKYEFELNVRAADAPVALQVRFRSGKEVSFTMSPVVKFDADSHFLACNVPGSSDDMWTLSLGGYEDRFLKRMTEHPSCVRQTLDIALFLHRWQAALTGVSELKDAHFRMALMHLLLLRGPAQWRPQHLASRLRDLLDFLEKSLEEKTLRHVLVGDPSAGKVADVPAEFTRAGAVNLFHPLATHSCLHRNAVKHLREILSNANMLIDDYVHQRPGHEVQKPGGWGWFQ